MQNQDFQMRQHMSTCINIGIHLPSYAILDPRWPEQCVLAHFSYLHHFKSCYIYLWLFIYIILYHSISCDSVFINSALFPAHRGAKPVNKCHNPNGDAEGRANLLSGGLRNLFPNAPSVMQTYVKSPFKHLQTLGIEKNLETYLLSSRADQFLLFADQ